MICSAHASRETEFSNNIAFGLGNERRIRHRQPASSGLALPELRLRDRLGFTILELLIVLAIVALMLALVWPQVKRRVAKSQLKQVAIDLKEQISEARQLSIRSGQLIEFGFIQGGHEYWVAPQQQRLGASNTAGNENDQIQIGMESIDSSAEESSADQSTIRESLDPSIQIYSSDRFESVEKDDQPSSFPVESIQVGKANVAAEDLNAKSILFSPDGRSRDLELKIIDRFNRIGVSVRIRGLTGQAEIGDSFVLRDIEIENDFRDEGELDALSFKNVDQLDAGETESGQ